MSLAMSFETPARKVWASERKSFSKRIYDAVLEAFGPSEKEAARAIGVTPRTLRNWHDEQCEPSGKQIREMSLRFRVVRDVVFEEYGMAQEIDDSRRMLREIQKQLANLGAYDETGTPRGNPPTP